MGGCLALEAPQPFRNKNTLVLPVLEGTVPSKNTDLPSADDASKDVQVHNATTYLEEGCKPVERGPWPPRVSLAGLP